MVEGGKTEPWCLIQQVVGFRDKGTWKEGQLGHNREAGSRYVMSVKVFEICDV
jgi:hypothetical protein